MSNVLVEESSLQNIANAIRTKNGSSDTYTPAGMSTAIENIPAGSSVVLPNGIKFGTEASSNSDFSFLESCDTSNLTTCSKMFYQCSNLTTVPLFNTANVTSMSSMFYQCTNTSFTTVPLFNTSSVTDMSQMFYQCQYLQTVPLFDTSSVTNMASMFRGCGQKLTTIPQFNTSSVTNMSQMFSSTKITQLPLLNTSSVTNMDNMFNNCIYLNNDSLNNIMQMCINAISYTGTKTLKQIGLPSSKATTCQSLSNYQAFLEAGWTTGY